MHDSSWCRLGDRFGEAFAKPRGLSIQACHVGPDAVEQLGSFSRRTLGGSCLLIADENTWRAGGEEVAGVLSAAGKRVVEHVFSETPLDATGETGDRVASLAEGMDFVVAVGSGTLCDLAKYAGDRLNLPVVLYATAASMNGYTSGVVALKVRGLKRTMPCRPALGVFANPEHVAMAPRRMTAAGVGDFLSKSSSTTDWRASHILLDVPFDERARSFVEGVQEEVIERAADIGRGEVEAVGLVLEALLLSGFSMVVAGSSAPASGGEHLISHYVDMKSALYGLPHDLHGAQVGVATVYCLGLWESVLGLEADAIDVEGLVARQASEEQVGAWIAEDWGPVAPEVAQQWAEKRMSRAVLDSFLRRVVGLWPRMRGELPTDLLPARVVRDAIRDAGGPVDAEDLDVPLEEYRKGQQRGRYIRNRFTILDLAQDLGLQ